MRNFPTRGILVPLVLSVPKKPFLSISVYSLAAVAGLVYGHVWLGNLSSRVQRELPAVIVNEAESVPGDLMAIGGGARALAASAAEQMEISRGDLVLLRQDLRFQFAVLRTALEQPLVGGYQAKAYANACPKPGKK